MRKGSAKRLDAAIVSFNKKKKPPIKLSEYEEKALHMCEAHD